MEWSLRLCWLSPSWDPSTSSTFYLLTFTNAIIKSFLPPSRNHGFHFEKAKTAFEEGGGRGELVGDSDSITEEGRAAKAAQGSRPASDSVDDEKVSGEQQKETA